VAPKGTYLNTPPYYELCALSELKNTLRSGDTWVEGSRQFKNFEDYLVPTEKFFTLKQTGVLSLAREIDCDRYLHDRLTLLETQLAEVNRLAQSNELPDAIITTSGLKITPLDAVLPSAAQVLVDQVAMMLPHCHFQKTTAQIS
jgi:hypothetical protein